MFLSSRFFPILLVMLQVIAPLAHAHAGKQSSGFGLHIPGLESYSAVDKMLMNQEAVFLPSAENVIFNMDDGIKQNRSITDRYTWDDNSSLLHYTAFIVLSQPFFFEDFFLSPPSISRSLGLLLSPRAPPVV